MRYSGLILNDVTAAPGLCVSFFTQGCPHRCENCHNPETWDFNGGLVFTKETMDTILKALNAQGIQRDLCVMGGEPLCNENLDITYYVISQVKQKLPATKIYIWTGYIYEEIQTNPKVMQILDLTDYLIDGPYIEELRDITLSMRGSSNQRIIDLSKKL